jgi:cellulose synthase operon protein C
MPFPGSSRRCARVLLASLCLTAPGNMAAWGQAAGERPATADSRRVPESLNFANGLLKDRHYDKAAEEYERFLKTGPKGIDEADARYGLANTRLFLGQYQDARKQFDEFLHVAPNHANAPTAWFRVGEMSYVLGDLPAARKALESYISLSSDAGHRFLDTALPYLGEICFALDDLPAARRAFERAERDFPKGRQVDRNRYGLARTLSAQGELDAAVKRLEELGRTGGPEWADKARFQIGVAYATAAQHAEAAEAFAEMERSAPRSALVPEARLRRAEALMKSNRPDDAERLLRTLAADAPQNLAAQAAETLGGSQWDRGKFADARATWNNALKRFPSSPLAASLWMRLGEADRQDGKPDEAKTRYLKVLEDFPKDPAAPVALIRASRMMLEANDPEGARDLASSFPNRFPNSALRADARLVEARAALALKQPKQAIELLESEEKPTPAARYVLGRAYQDDGQKEKGDAMLESLANASDAGAASSDALFLIGQKNFDSEKYEEAIEPLRKYLADKPKGDVAADALAYLVVTHAKLGREPETQRYLATLIKEFPRAKPLAWARLSLAGLLTDQKEFDRASELVRPVAEEGPPEYRLRAQSELAWSLLQGGKPMDAVALFDALIQAAPKDPLAAEAARGRGRALDAAGKTDDALSAYDLVIRNYPKSPEASTAALARARLLMRAKRPADASAAYERYLENYTQTGSEPPDLVLADWAAALLDAQKSIEADRVYRRLLDEFPASPRTADARLQLAVSAQESHKLDEAIRLLEPVVAENSKAAATIVQSALFLMGKIQAERKDWPAATKTFARLASEYRDGLYAVEARFWAAETVFQGGEAGAAESKAAEAEFTRFIDELRSNPKAAEWIKTARLRRIQCQILLQHWDDVLSNVKAFKDEIAADDPRLAEAEFARGRALQGQPLPRFDDARASFDFVIKARPGTELAARAQLMRGETFFHQRDYREALREFLKVDILYKGAPRWQALALLEAGKVEELLDQWSDAADLYQKFLSKYPQDPNAPEATRRLQQAKARLAGGS